MTVSTATENEYSSYFRDFIGKLDEPQWLRDLRTEAFGHFASTGFPTPRLEDWKYTNIAAAVKHNWKVGSSHPTCLPELDEQVERQIRAFDFARNGLTALNFAFADFRVIRVPKETSIEVPIELTFAAEENAAIFPHVIVIAEPGSKATLLEVYSTPGNGLTNAAVRLAIAAHANLTHYRVQKDAAGAYNFGTTEVALDAGSRYDATSINLGAALSRHDIDLKFTAEGGEARVDGLYMLNGTQHSDTHSVIDHTVPNCSSRQIYKGVLNDKSRGVFNGKVFVRENAHGTDAQQSNKNLLLSNDAQVDTKPQLEIFNDDVKCSHGATVGQLEDEELFYLLTRGLPEPLARNLLTYGFAEEIINKIAIDEIKQELDAAVLNRLQTKI